MSIEADLIATRVFKLHLDRVVECAMRDSANDNSPIGLCMIDVEGHPTYYYSSISLNASRQAAQAVGGNYRFKFERRA